MKNAKGCCITTFIRSMLLLPVAILAISGCAHQSHSFKKPQQSIWQHRDQFVAVVEKDGPPSTPPNNHPAELSTDQIQGALGTLTLNDKGAENSIPLFSNDELKVLGEQIRTGLAQASPEEDITFAIIGNHLSFYGLAKRRMVTTGRVFYYNRKLNLILGMIHEDVSDYDDRRLKPFYPGSRTVSTKPVLKVTASTGENILFASDRPDWLILSPNSATPPVTQTPVPEKVSSPASRSIEERLLLLDELKRKNLISEDEYQTKRRKILDLL